MDKEGKILKKFNVKITNSMNVTELEILAVITVLISIPENSKIIKTDDSSVVNICITN